MTDHTRFQRLLDAVSIAAPCHADWDQMRGRGRVRHCGDCQKNVYEISAMTAEQAAALIEKHEGNLCVRLYRRNDGTVLTTDCPLGVRAARRVRGWVAGVAAACITLMAGVGLAQRRGDGGSSSPISPFSRGTAAVSTQVLMGAICPPTRPPTYLGVSSQYGTQLKAIERDLGSIRVSLDDPAGNLTAEQVDALTAQRDALMELVAVIEIWQAEIDAGGVTASPALLDKHALFLAEVRSLHGRILSCQTTTVRFSEGLTLEPAPADGEPAPPAGEDDADEGNAGDADNNASDARDDVLKNRSPPTRATRPTGRPIRPTASPHDQR